TTPAPPVVPVDGMEPDVAAAVRAACEKVRRNLRSGAAWGELGQVLLAHNATDLADPCFAQAERFAPDNPRWPYYRGWTRSSRSPADAIPYLRRAVSLCDRFDRGNDAPRLLLAEMLLQTDALDEAEEHLNRVLGWKPDDP